MTTFNPFSFTGTTGIAWSLTQPLWAMSVPCRWSSKISVDSAFNNVSLFGSLGRQGCFHESRLQLSTVKTFHVVLLQIHSPPPPVSQPKLGRTSSGCHCATNVQKVVHPGCFSLYNVEHLFFSCNSSAIFMRPFCNASNSRLSKSFFSKELVPADSRSSSRNGVLAKEFNLLHKVSSSGWTLGFRIGTFRTMQEESYHFKIAQICGFLFLPEILKYSLSEIPTLLFQLSRLLQLLEETLGYPVVPDLFRQPDINFLKCEPEFRKTAAFHAEALSVSTCSSVCSTMSMSVASSSEVTPLWCGPQVWLFTRSCRSLKFPFLSGICENRCRQRKVD